VRTVFFGTPEAAMPSLLRLANDHDVIAVVTQPDRPRGRSGTPQPPPVKAAASQLGLQIHQPSRSSEIEAILRSLGPVDVAVIVAFGMLIRPGAIAVPKAGFINLHFSLLPRWRGAAPVQRALIAGDERTGVTLMQLDAGLDTGPTLVTCSTAIGESETAGTLSARLSAIGAHLLAAHLSAAVAGRIIPVPQEAAKATHAPKLSGDDRRYLPDVDAQTLRRSIMAMAPAPGLSALHGEQRLKLLLAGQIRLDAHAQPPGTLAEAEGRLWCHALDGQVELLEVQPAGKRVMNARDWMRGRAGRLGRLT
jgi:methionyl-tRNA formyltransferase